MYPEETIHRRPCQPTRSCDPKPPCQPICRHQCTVQSVHHQRARSRPRLIKKYFQSFFSQDKKIICMHCTGNIWHYSFYKFQVFNLGTQKVPLLNRWYTMSVCFQAACCLNMMALSMCCVVPVNKYWCMTTPSYYRRGSVDKPIANLLLQLAASLVIIHH